MALNTNSHRRILTIGSAHLDIISRALFRNDVVDKIGTLSHEVGGTGCNIAINAAQMGCESHFVTALNKSAFSRMIETYLSKAGVIPHIHYDEALPDAGFNAHLDTSGELVSAVSSMPVERAALPPDLLLKQITNVSAVVADCNLSTQQLNLVGMICRRQGVPFYICGVSEEKSTRIGKVTCQISGIFLNRREFEFFCKETTDIVMSVSDFAKALNTEVFVSDGANGVTVALPDGSFDSILPPGKVDAGTRIGMGDALAAGTVVMKEFFKYHSFDAVRAAGKVVLSVGNMTHCHMGATGGMEKILKSFQDQAMTDTMTGLLNRRGISEEMKMIDRRAAAEGLSVLMLDIDHFKRINDNFGHKVGDEVIIAVAKAIKSVVRSNDLVGRWGGEEFLVILRSPGDTTEKIGWKINLAVASMTNLPTPCTVSVGGSECVAGDVMNAIERADKALYQSKNNGRNMVTMWGKQEICAAQKTG